MLNVYVQIFDVTKNLEKFYKILGTFTPTLAVPTQHSNSSSSCGGLQLRRVHSRITVEWYIPSPIAM
jgi:hypothetical protein